MSEIIGIFGGLALLLLAGVVSYMFYHIARMYKEVADEYVSEGEIERSARTRVALKKGIDIRKEKLAKKMYDSSAFRRRLRQEVIDDFFGKEKDKK